MRRLIAIATFLSFCICNAAMSSGGYEAAKPAMPKLRAIVLDMEDEDQTLRKSVPDNDHALGKMEQSIHDMDEYHTKKLKEFF